jgi:hypothetical protein
MTHFWFVTKALAMPIVWAMAAPEICHVKLQFDQLVGAEIDSPAKMVCVLGHGAGVETLASHASDANGGRRRWRKLLR